MTIKFKYFSHSGGNLGKSSGCFQPISQPSKTVSLAKKEEGHETFCGPQNPMKKRKRILWQNHFFRLKTNKVLGSWILLIAGHPIIHTLKRVRFFPHFCHRVFLSGALSAALFAPGFFTYATSVIPPFDETESKNTVTQNARQSVWKIQIQQEEMEGSGFFISPRRFVTTFHAINNNHAIKHYLLRLNGIDLNHEELGLSLKVNRLVAVSASLDLALLETEGEAPAFLPICHSREEGAETDLSVLGYPGLSKGGLLRMRQIGNLPALISSDLMFFSVNKTYLHGVSGGPVLNAEGCVTGLAVLSARNFLGAVKTNLLKSFVEGGRGVLCGEEEAAESCVNRAFALLRSLADQEDLSALFRLGSLLFQQKDYEEGVQLWKRAASADHIISQYSVALTLQIDDIELTKYWIAKGIEHDFALSLYDLGYRMYRTRNSYEEAQAKIREEEAFHLMLRAAQYGFGPALTLISEFYSEGVGVEKNAEKANYWLNRTGEQDELDFFNQLNQ